MTYLFDVQMWKENHNVLMWWRRKVTSQNAASPLLSICPVELSALYRPLFKTVIVTLIYYTCVTQEILMMMNVVKNVKIIVW